MTPSSSPTLAVLVGNSFMQDARVRKTARAAVEAGYDVTVLAIADADHQGESVVDGARVRWLTLNAMMQRRAMRRRQRARRVLIPVGYRDAERSDEALRSLTLARREHLAAKGAARADGAPGPLSVGREKVRGARLVARSKLTYARVKVQRSLYSGAPIKQLSDRAVGRVSWRRELPLYLDLEMAIGPALDELAPDLVHANDSDMVGIAARHAARRRLTGERCAWLYDAHEFVPGLARYSRRHIAALAAVEDEYAPAADAVITVSEPISDALQTRWRLAQRPRTVLNAPYLVEADPSGPSVRAAAGLADDVPLMVYSGNINPDRGLDTFVSALAHLPGVHLVIVTNALPGNWYVEQLRATARADGTLDRLHVVPYVATEQIIGYLSSADIGVHGLTHVPNHEMALPNKIFDYVHASLPVVVSDVKALSEFVEQVGFGEVYVADDVDSFAAAARKVLAARDDYRRPLESEDLRRTYSWDGSARVLVDVYRSLVPVGGTNDDEVG